MGPEINRQFMVGDLVYYRGFAIFPDNPPRKHMGIVVAVPDGLPHASSYVIYWFETGLTARIHYDMIDLVRIKER